MLAQSTLAKALATLYMNITTTGAAVLSFSSQESELSVQIPIAPSLESLPSSMSSQRPGMWLSTAPRMTIELEDQHPGSQLSAHFGLLLLSDQKSIVDPISSVDSPVTKQLIHYVRVSRPTKSFLRESESLGISLPEVQLLASHLIFWRKVSKFPSASLTFLDCSETSDIVCIVIQRSLLRLILPKNGH